MWNTRFVCLKTFRIWTFWLKWSVNLCIEYKDGVETWKEINTSKKISNNKFQSTNSQLWFAKTKILIHPSTVLSSLNLTDVEGGLLILHREERLHMLPAPHVVVGRSIGVHSIAASNIMVNVDKFLSMQACCTLRLNFRLTNGSVVKLWHSSSNANKETCLTLPSEGVNIFSLFKGFKACVVVVLCGFPCGKPLKCTCHGHLL